MEIELNNILLFLFQMMSTIASSRKNSRFRKMFPTYSRCHFNLAQNFLPIRFLHENICIIKLTTQLKSWEQFSERKLLWRHQLLRYWFSLRKLTSVPDTIAQLFGRRSVYMLKFKISNYPLIDLYLTQCQISSDLVHYW